MYKLFATGQSDATRYGYIILKNRKKYSVGRRPLLVAVEAVFLLVFGYFLFALVTSYNNQTRIATTYEPIDALVISSRVVSFRSPGTQSARTYSIKIDYSYTVKGRSYRADQYSFMSGQEFRDFSGAKSALENYRPVQKSRHPHHHGAGYRGTLSV